MFQQRRRAVSCNSPIPLHGIILYILHVSAPHFLPPSFPQHHQNQSRQNSSSLLLLLCASYATRLCMYILYLFDSAPQKRGGNVFFFFFFFFLFFVVVVVTLLLLLLPFLSLPFYLKTQCPACASSPVSSSLLCRGEGEKKASKCNVLLLLLLSLPV